MSEGILLVCDECIRLSQNTAIIRFEDKWQSYINGELSKDFWDRGISICIGLCALIDTKDKVYKLIWENGDCRDIKITSELGMLEEIITFIINHENLEGLSERAFIRDGNGIIEYERKNIDDDYNISLDVFRSSDGCPIYRCQVMQEFYYGVMDKEKTAWVVDISCGYDNIEYTQSGIIILSYRHYVIDGYDSKIHLVYNQKDIIEPFHGNLFWVDKHSNIYEYIYEEPLWEGEDVPMTIGDIEYTNNCLVKITECGVEIVAQYPQNNDKETKALTDALLNTIYYNEEFILWGYYDVLKELGGYKISGFNTVFYGYALNIKGEYYFNKSKIVVVDGILRGDKEEGIKDIIAYCDRGEEGLIGMIITPKLGKVVDIGRDDVIYREDGGI